jgi:hypothetical protein
VILRDSIEVLDDNGNTIATLSCHVSVERTEATFSAEFGQILLSEELALMVKPTAYATPNRLWRWRGKVYRSDGEPKVRRRRGRDHHYTIRIR